MDTTYHLNGGYKPTVKRFADLDGPDFFPTPSWATEALIDNETFDGDIWECACGNGAMSAVLETVNKNVASSDLYDRGYGEASIDFLDTQRRADNIVTNRAGWQRFEEQHGQRRFRSRACLPSPSSGRW